MKIEEKPFSWHDNFAEEAMDCFHSSMHKLDYCTCQSVGLALQKLKMIENGSLKVKVKNESEVEE